MLRFILLSIYVYTPFTFIPFQLEIIKLLLICRWTKGKLFFPTTNKLKFIMMSILVFAIALSLSLTFNKVFLAQCIQSKQKTMSLNRSMAGLCVLIQSYRLKKPAQKNCYSLLKKMNIIKNMKRNEIQSNQCICAFVTSHLLFQTNRFPNSIEK